MEIHPMDQFIVKPLFGDGPLMWYTPSNTAMWMALTVIAVSALLVAGTARQADVPGRVQMVAELGYGFIRNMVESVARKRRLAVFSLHHDGVHVYPVVKCIGTNTGEFYPNIAHSGYSVVGVNRFHNGNDNRVCQTRFRLSPFVLDLVGTIAVAPGVGRD